ncbi:type I-E CRISPR-associated protein Cas7/Cse4/CasC [Desulforhopalus singaporensis]|uniref:CRISPR system Cascade subunit CasC n=1 Tax=Desulforhopalus singaporensis TaxID=91360 RepID=A0A1H0TV34_9BACT|nr:type I-E CRISPR-associated protein Cas7/Cse4/CasC [Desulforhopalus singaporensis]SDP57794.1 CRISPR system Cascade subunit CasC [Desulforhopalus singaporensis]
MKHLELHIIQSVPVACLNRDDLNSPKTAIFGGVQRARVSSQSWKRAIRELAKEIDAAKDTNLFKGERTRRMVYTMQQRLVALNFPKRSALKLAECVADIVETLDSKQDEAGFKKIKTVMFFSPAEYDAVALAIHQSDAVSENIEELEKLLALNEELDISVQNCNDKDQKKVLDKELKEASKQQDKTIKAMSKVLAKGPIATAIKSVKLNDAADIALFGRMVANDPTLRIDGAAMFAHVLSTHKADNEIDFFSAVDDLTKDESGAGMTSTLEFNSATYYRFAALNLDELASDSHLGDTKLEDGTLRRDIEVRKQVVRTFLEATIKAIPSARKNSMNANTMPDYVLGIVRETGHPIQLVNAFEQPVRRSSDGFTCQSIEKLNQEYANLQEVWGIDALFAKSIVNRRHSDAVISNLGKITTCKFSELIDGMVEHVI